VADHPRNPRNAAGPFYVLKAQCISCGAPQAEAPGLVTLDDEVGCYFRKQPDTAGEVNDAIRAMFVSCVEAYRYGGTDPLIRRRLAELGYSHLCDHPLEGHPVVLRNHVRFSLAHGAEATEVARQLLSAFETTWKNGACTKVVAGDTRRAEFEFTHSTEYGTPRGYAVERVRTPVPVGPPSVYRDPSTVDVWLLVEEDGRHPPTWLHEVLVKNGAANIRWFSRDEWNARAVGEELPY
jgi:hypothetical protein